MMNLSLDFSAPAGNQPPFHAQQSIPRPVRSSWSDYDRTAPKSPWGPVQHMTDYRNGCVEVSTAGHGGMKVEGALAKKLPTLFRKKWYEEDCEVLIPLFYLYDDLKVIADTLSDDEAGRCGFIAAVKRLSKDKCLERLLSYGTYAAIYDFINKINRPDDFFRGDYQRKAYADGLARLKNPAPVKTLVHGQVIRFKSPICFSVDRKDVEVTDFVVIKDGRKVLFKPIGHTFTARISNWKKYEYSNIELPKAD